MNRVSGASSRRAAGFTLIELMVTAFIIVILAGIAWPSYLDFVRRGKRAEAISVLLETMQQQERLYSRRNSYLAYTRDDNPEGMKWHSGATPARSSHELSARPCEGQALSACVELLAIPGTGSVDSAYRDPRCGTLILNSQGLRSPADAACWQ